MYLRKEKRARGPSDEVQKHIKKCSPKVEF